MYPGWILPAYSDDSDVEAKVEEARTMILRRHNLLEERQDKAPPKNEKFPVPTPHAQKNALCGANVCFPFSAGPCVTHDLTMNHEATLHNNLEI